jgi:peroxiredoxin
MLLERAGPDFSTGLDPGEAMPDFTLPDHLGRPVNFHDARAGRRALVHFFRSTVW